MYISNSIVFSINHTKLPHPQRGKNKSTPIIFHSQNQASPPKKKLPKSPRIPQTPDHPSSLMDLAHPTNLLHKSLDISLALPLRRNSISRPAAASRTRPEELVARGPEKLGIRPRVCLTLYKARRPISRANYRHTTHRRRGRL